MDKNIKLIKTLMIIIATIDSIAAIVIFIGINLLGNIDCSLPQKPCSTEYWPLLLLLPTIIYTIASLQKNKIVGIVLKSISIPFLIIFFLVTLNYLLMAKIGR